MPGHSWRVGQGQACPPSRGAWGGDRKQGDLTREERKERGGPLLLGWGELSRARELGMGGTLGPVPLTRAQSPAMSNSSVAATAVAHLYKRGLLPPMSWTPRGLQVGSGFPGASEASFCLPGSPVTWRADHWVAARPRESWLPLTLRAAPAPRSLRVPGECHQSAGLPSSCSSNVASRWGCQDLCV